MSINNQRAAKTVRNWNAHFPPGTEVEYQGRRLKTWSYAGMGKKDSPSVWLEGIEELVPIDVLKVPGWDTHRR